MASVASGGGAACALDLEVNGSDCRVAAVIGNRGEWSGREDSNPQPSSPKADHFVYENLLKLSEAKAFDIEKYRLCTGSLRGSLGALTVKKSTTAKGLDLILSLYEYMALPKGHRPDLWLMISGSPLASAKLPLASAQ
jgi:hypothetical protein